MQQGPDAVEQLIAIVDRLHAEFRQQLAVELAGDLEAAHRQYHVSHPVDFDCHCRAPHLAFHKRRPDAIRVPNRFHLSARLGLVLAEHIATISIEKRRDPVVRDAMDVHGDLL